MASGVARIGGWTYDTAQDRVNWSDEVCRIHEMPPGTAPRVEEAIAYFAPESRGKLRLLVEACLRDGMPYDEELQIIIARGRSVWVRSIGEAVRGADGAITDIGELLKRADLAMYEAKGAGRNTLRLFNPGMQAALSARMALENDLRQAVRECEREFDLHYQPQIGRRRQVTGVEAPVLETVAVPGIDARRLKLELTETSLLENIDDTIAKMNVLKLHGVSFALDDFGTGYSSLAYLKQLPLDMLKIDRSFVLDLLTNQNDAVIARTIIALGHSLGLRVLAEGVETAAQRDFLFQHGCDAYQGYLCAPALPASVAAAVTCKP
jgi:EAL domain-containing protein (putative c-di-GMP-specific phosphodiesterase class I)